MHLLEFRSRNVLTSFEYDSIIDYTPSLNHMLLITGSDKKQSKIIVNTNQVRPKNRAATGFPICQGKQQKIIFSLDFSRPSKSRI